MGNWTEKIREQRYGQYSPNSPYYWERVDGFVVQQSINNVWMNTHLGEDKIRPWIAYLPGSDSYLGFRHQGKYRASKLITPRRWKTAEAAMKAVDKEYPERVMVVHLSCPECRLAFDIWFDSEGRVSDMEQECHCTIASGDVERLAEIAEFEVQELHKEEK